MICVCVHVEITPSRISNRRHRRAASGAAESFEKNIQNERRKIIKRKPKKKLLKQKD